MNPESTGLWEGSLHRRKEQSVCLSRPTRIFVGTYRDSGRCDEKIVTNTEKV